jgi:hypothetical protein
MPPTVRARVRVPIGLEVDEEYADLGGFAERTQIAGIRADCRSGPWSSRRSREPHRS